MAVLLRALLLGVGFAVVVPAFHAFLARARHNEVERSSSSVEVRFAPRFWKGTMLLPSPIIPMVLYVVLVRHDDPVVGLLCCVVALALVLPFAAFFAWYRVVVSAEGLERRFVPWRSTMAWNEVRSIRWRPGLKMLQVLGERGSISFFVDMSGLASLAAWLLDRAGEKIVIDSRQELERWARGSVPKSTAWPGNQDRATPGTRRDIPSVGPSVVSAATPETPGEEPTTMPGGGSP